MRSTTPIRDGPHADASQPEGPEAEKPQRRKERQVRKGVGLVVEPSARLNALSHEVIGAAIEVHRVLGPGFLESVYEAALSVELTRRGVSHRRQVAIRIDFKGVQVGHSRVDLLVEEQ